MSENKNNSENESEKVSVAWVLNQLAGMSFPEQGSAYDFIRSSLEIKTTDSYKFKHPE